MSPRPIAFSPAFAAPRSPLLWSGQGIGAATPVATPGGPVAADRLQRGGRVFGAAGQVLTLTSVHHITLPATVFRRLGLSPPLLMAAGALGFGLPTAPLVVGPAQRIHLAGNWVEADCLVDGLGIVRLEGDRQIVQLLHNGTGPLLAAGLMVASAGACAEGALGAASSVLAQAEILLRLADASGVPAGPLDGFVDHADRFGVVGWALDTAAPERVVPLQVLVAGQVVAHALANRPRPDLLRALARAGRGTALARHGFAVRFTTPLPTGRSWMVTLRHAGGGRSLPGTPLLLDAAAPDPARFDTALAGLTDGEAAAAFLARLVDGATKARRR